MEIEGDGLGYCHPFLNIRGLYSSSLFYGAKSKLRQWAEKELTSGSKIAIAYSLTVYTLSAMKYLKQLNPRIKTAIIIPDIPEYTYLNSKNSVMKIRNWLAKKRINKKIATLFPYVDKAILFSDKMTEKIDCADRYMVFEGLYTEQFEQTTEERLFSKDKKEIVYAGGLSEVYGVKLLLDAFSEIKNSDYRLILAGRGPMEAAIREVAQSDSRIVFLGEIPRERLLAIEKGADVLVNPRVNSGVFTRYSFPSKNMEYMSSGTPMIGYKLEGILEIYDKYINYFREETPESLAHCIEHICTVENAEARLRAKEAKKYIAKYKTGDFWAEAIIEFIRDDS